MRSVEVARAAARVRLAIAMGVLVCWAALLALLSHVASLPRAASPGAGLSGSHRMPLAHTDKLVYLVRGQSEAIEKVSLPSYELETIFDLGAVPTSVAWDGKRMLVALGVYKNGWGLLAGDKWLVPPRWEGEHRVSVFRDDESGALMLAKLGKLEFGEDGEAKRSLALFQVDAQGHPEPKARLQIAVLVQDQFCGSAQRLFATTQVPGEVCRVMKADAGATWPCKAVKQAKLQCPNVISLGAPRQLIDGEQQRPFQTPPRALVERGDMPSRYWFKLKEGGGVDPEAQWFSERNGSVVSVPGGFVSANLDDATLNDERLGQNRPEHMEFRLWDARATSPKARVKVFGERFQPELIVASGDELTAEFFDGRGYARFDRNNLERLDATDWVWAVRSRLQPWGGKSWLFEYSLLAALLFGLPVAAALILSKEHARWQKPISLAYLSVVLVVLYWVVRRTWWL